MRVSRVFKGCSVIAVWLAIALGGFCAAASPARADQPAAPTAVMSAVVILVPGQPEIDAPAGGPFRYPSDGSVIRLESSTSTASTRSGKAPAATATIALTRGRLFRGLVRLAGAASGAQATTAADGAQSTETSSSIHRLRVDGTPITPAAGDEIPLGHWGYAVVDAETPSSKPIGVTVVALDVHLTRAHADLPAGTEIQIGRSVVAVPPPPPPPTDPSGGGGSGRGGSHTRHAEQPHQAKSVASTPTRAPSRHPGGSHTTTPQHPPHRRPALPKRAFTVDPHTLPSGLRGRIVAAAESQIGWPYVWGGETEREGGFDCSGLVDYAYAIAGHALPGRPTAEVLWLASQRIRESQLLPGDLVFLLDRDRYAYHVGIYAGHGRVVVAAHRGTDVALVALGSVPWNGFGRLFQPNRVAIPDWYTAPIRPLRPTSARASSVRQTRAAEPTATARLVARPSAHRPGRRPQPAPPVLRSASLAPVMKAEAVAAPPQRQHGATPTT